MTNEAGAPAPVYGRFRPESLSHFKEVAKNIAWLLERPMQKCQEDLACIYGYSGLHELQQVLGRPGTPGPFDPRYNYLGSDDEALVEGHERCIFFILFGPPKGYWREYYNAAQDRCFLVFEMGLFQEAAEHRACVEKIRQVLTYEVSSDRWPLIHGWPLGLKSWLVSRYTEPVDLAEGWQKVLPESRFAGYDQTANADIRRQRRMAGLARLATMFQILAPRVGGGIPTSMKRVAFELFDEEGGGINDSQWEADCLFAWLIGKSSRNAKTDGHQLCESIQAFVQRPSRATAAACDFVKDLQDPVGFRDRWAFESLKAALDSFHPGTKALFSSTLDEGAILSIFLQTDLPNADLGESCGCQLWELYCTWSEVTEPEHASRKPTLQPVIHANATLIVPYDDDLTVISPDDWYFLHGWSDFASEAAAVVFEKFYLPAIGVEQLDFFTYLQGLHRNLCTIVEIDELLLAPTVTAEDLKSYFDRLLAAFDSGACLPDSYGYWSDTLSLVFEDDGENENRNENGEYADYVYAPSVLLISVPGCGLTSVEATHRNDTHVSTLTRHAGKKPNIRAATLASMVMEAVKGLDVDVVVYDGEM